MIKPKYGIHDSSRRPDGILEAKDREKGGGGIRPSRLGLIYQTRIGSRGAFNKIREGKVCIDFRRSRGLKILRGENPSIFVKH